MDYRVFICSCNSTIKTTAHKWSNNNKHKNCKFLRVYFSKKHSASITRVNSNILIMSDFKGLFIVKETEISRVYNQEFSSMEDSENTALKYIKNMEFI